MDVGLGDNSSGSGAIGIDKIYFLDTKTNEVTSADIKEDGTYSVVLKTC